MDEGREILFGADYKARANEVLERDRHRCQWPYLIPMGLDGISRQTICNAVANEHPHHKIKRSKGRDDRASNLMAICDAHHLLAHPEFQPRFTRSVRATQ